MIIFSTFESNYFKLNVGRAVCDAPTDVLDIIKEAKKKQFNIVRIESKYKIDMEELFYIRTINDYKHSYKTSDNPIGLNVRKIQTEEDAIFFEKELYNNYLGDSLGYINHPSVRAKYPYLNKELEAKCYASFFRTNFTPSNDNKGTLLFSQNEDCVGGYIYEIVGDGVYTSVAFVLEKYRKSGFFKQFHLYRENLFFGMGIKYGFHGGRSDNISVNNFYLEEGYEIIEQRHIYVMAL